MFTRLDELRGSSRTLVERLAAEMEVPLRGQSDICIDFTGNTRYQESMFK
jgi:hypothetical protein